MPDVDDLLKEHEAEKKKLADLEAAIKARGGEVPGNGNGDKDPINRMTRDAQLAETFTRMSTAEQMRLHDEQHEVWEEMLNAVRREGELKLFARKV